MNKIEELIKKIYSPKEKKWKRIALLYLSIGLFFFGGIGLLLLDDFSWFSYFILLAGGIGLYTAKYGNNFWVAFIFGEF